MNTKDAGLSVPEQLEPEAPYVPPDLEAEENIQHSLFGEILDWMLAPLLLLWPMSIAITYLVAKAIANQPFDHALEDSVTVLSQQVRQVDGKIKSRAAGSARDMLRVDDVDHVYFQIAGPGKTLIDGDRDLPQPKDPERYRTGTVHFRNDVIHGAPVRVAFSYLNLHGPAHDVEDSSHEVLVQVAETQG